jgi:hypothetical protein
MVQTLVSLTSALVWGEWSASRFGRFIPVTHWLEVWVGPRANVDDMEKWKFLTMSGLEFRPVGRQTVASSYTYYATYLLTPWP